MITRFDKIYGCFILLFLSCFIVSNAIAADKIGAVAAVIGTVSIERNGEVVKVKPGSAVFENDKILTGKSSRAQVLLMDQTAINIGQKAELVLDKFVFNSEDDEVALKVTKGTFRFISGKVATKTPEKVNVETPVATIGVRGTEFVGQIGSVDTTVALLNGRIEVANDISTQFVTNPGFGVTIDPTSGVISPPVKIPQAELEAVLNSVSTDRDALLEEEIEGGPGPDDEGGPGPDGDAGPDPDGEAGPGPDGDAGPGPDGEFGPGPDGEFGPGPDGDFGPGPDGDFGPGPDGDFGPGPDGDFGPGPNGDFGPGPNGDFGPGPGGDPLDFATGGEDLAGGPDGDFGPSPGGPGFDDFGPAPGGPGFDDFGPAPGGPGFDDFGPGPGGPGFDDFGPGPGGPGFDDFGPGPGGPPPMDLFYAGDPNMAPEGTFVFGDGFFEAGGDPFFVGIPGPDQFGPDGSFDQFGPGPGPGTGGDFGPAPNSLDPGSVPPPGPGGDFGPGPGGPGYDDFGPGPGGPGFDDFGPGPGGPGFDDFGFGPGPGGPGFDDFGFGPGPGGPGFDDFGFGPGPGMGGDYYDPMAGGGNFYPMPGGGDYYDPVAGGGDYYDPMAGGTYYDPAFAYYDPLGGGIYYDNHVIQDIQQDQIVFGIIDDNASPSGSAERLRFNTPTSFSRFENDNTPLFIPVLGGAGSVSFSVASASDVVDGAGEDSLLFEIDPSTGELFRAGNPDVSLDFETPLDVLADNVYKLTLSITDGVDTVTQDFEMAVQNLPLMVGSQFENNIGVTDNDSPAVLDTFQQFGSQEAFLAAMSDGTLTWNVTYGSGAARVCQGGGSTCIKLDTVNLVVKTLGRTIDFDVTGDFENMKISAFEEATGEFSIGIPETKMKDFSGLEGFVPGKFTVSSGALTGAVTAAEVNMTANTINDVGVSPTDVSGQLDLVVEAQIGASSSATDDFTAVVNTLIKDVDQESTSMSVGIGQPTVTP